MLRIGLKGDPVEEKLVDKNFCRSTISRSSSFEEKPGSRFQYLRFVNCRITFDIGVKIEATHYSGGISKCLGRRTEVQPLYVTKLICCSITLSGLISQTT